MSIPSSRSSLGEAWRNDLHNTGSLLRRLEARARNQLALSRRENVKVFERNFCHVWRDSDGGDVEIEELR